MQAAELRFSPSDQARELLEKARLAASMAAQRRNGAIMPFVRILLDGGVILKTLSSGRVVINLGRRTGAREGLSFAFYSGADGSFKGELVLLQAGSQESTAEIIHLADPSVLPAAGDILVRKALNRGSLPERRRKRPGQAKKPEAELKAADFTATGTANLWPGCAGCPAGPNASPLPFCGPMGM